MKKLMIAAAIVCAAAMSQAASFNWTASGDLTTDGSTVATSMTGKFALVYLGNNAENIDWTTATVVDRNTATFKKSMGTDTAKVDAKSFIFEIGSASEGTGYANGDIFGVLFEGSDSKLYYLTDASGNKLEPTYTISGLENDSSTLSSFTFSSSAYQANTSMPVQSVPEPTSGLLLALGIAGMALRRRRV